MNIRKFVEELGLSQDVCWWRLDDKPDGKRQFIKRKDGFVADVVVAFRVLGVH